MSTRSHIKTEHTGAKNGGGYYGRRAEAKAVSNRRRREADKREATVGQSCGPKPGY